MGVVSQRQHEEAVKDEQHQSRLAHRMQQALAEMRNVSKWINLLCRENPERDDFLVFEQRMLQLLEDFDAEFQVVRDRLLKAREEGAKPVSTKV